MAISKYIYFFQIFLDNKNNDIQINIISN